MDTVIKEHDLFAARMLNPDKGLSYFISEEGLSSQNTQLESKEFYKNKEKVKEFFTDDSGKFNQEEFDKFYKQISLEYSYLNNMDSAKFIFDTYEKSAADFTTPFGEVKDYELEVERVANPLEQTYNLVGQDVWSTPTLSAREAAQKNLVKTGEDTWSDETLNNIGLGIVAKDPIVYATYNEDGYHIDPISGKKTAHRKGEFKIDEFGKYYTEYADKSENLDKQFVTLSEVFTDDEKWTNYLDIFDSDNAEQSIFRTAVRATALTAATFIPYLGPTIVYGTAALEFAKALPGLAKMINGFANDTSSEALNSWDNHMRKFNISQTDAAREKGFWALENVITMVQDSFMQLTQQRAIAQLPDKIFNVEKRGKVLLDQAKKQGSVISALTGAEINSAVKASAEFQQLSKLYEDSRKVSDIISKVYLTTTAMQDTFNTSRQNGLNQETSAYVTLLSMAGMYSLLKTDYFRGLLTNTPDYELAQEMRQVTKRYTQLLVDDIKKKGIVKEVAEEAAKGNKIPFYKTLAQKAQKLFGDHVQEVSSGKFGVVPGMVAEGLEELSEEVMQDTAVQLARGLQKVKATLTGKDYSDTYKWSNTDPLARYSASLFGGALGGAVFKTADLLHFQRDAYRQWTQMLNSKQELGNKIIDYVASGKSAELMKEFGKLQQTPIASKTISALTGEATTNESESINRVIFKNIEDSIKTMESFIRSKGVGISKDDLENVEYFKNVKVGLLKQEGIIDMLHREYLGKMEELLGMHGERVANENKLKDATNVDKEAIESEINRIDKTIDSKTKEIKDLISGNTSQYMGMVMLKMNPEILNGILPTDKDSIAQNRFHSNYDQLPKYLQTEVDSVIKNMKDGSFDDVNLSKAWNVYKTVSEDKTLQTNLSSVENELGDYTSQITRDELSMRLMISELYDLDKEDITLDDINAIAKIFSSGVYKTYKTVNIDRIGGQIESEEDYDSPILEKINSDSTKQIMDDIRKALVSAEEKIKKDPKVYDKKDSELSKDELYEKTYLSAYGSVNAFDKVWNKLVAAASKSYFVDDVIQYYNANTLYSTLNHIFSKFGIDPEFDVFSSINAQLASRDVLKHNYRLSPEIQAQFGKIKSLIQIAKAIVGGANKNAKHTYKGIIIGANNELNLLFEDRGIKESLAQVNENAAFELLTELDKLSSDIESLERSDRENSGKLVTRDKAASIERAKAKLKAMRFIFESDEFKAQFDAQVPTFTISEETDEVKLATQLRQSILDFESWFSSYYLGLKDSSDLLNFIINKLIGGDSSILREDPGKLSNENFVFESADQFWYLLSLCSDNAINISETYAKEVTGEAYTKCPFDMQEEIAVQAARLAVVDNKTRKQWVDSIERSGDQGFAHNIIKTFGLAGVGKSDAIIPMISKFTGKKVILSVNTEIQRSDMKKRFGDTIEIYLHNEILSKDETFFDKNKDALIIFDESTNIEAKKIGEYRDGKNEVVDVGNDLVLDKLFDTYNITGIFLGDPTQVGNSSNINNIVCPATLQMYEPIRSQFDILRQNLQMLRNQFIVSDSGNDAIKQYSDEDVLLYYQDDNTFVGHKYVDFDSNNARVNYVKTFLETYGKGKRVMVFSSDKAVIKELEKIDNIDIFGDVASVQGSEWDYVICLDDLSFNSKNSNGTVYDNARKVNTVLGRAQLGTILPTLNGTWRFKNVVSKFPPVEIGLSDEVIKDFKEFKTKVLSSLKFNTKIQPGSKGQKPVEVVIPEVKVVIPPVADNSNGIITEGRATTDWILTDEDKPAVYGYPNKEDYYSDRYLLYRALTENNKSLIPAKLQNGKFVFSVKTNLDQTSFATFGNTNELDKWVSKDKAYTFVAYVYTDTNGNEKIMHLGMVFTESAFNPFGYSVSDMTIKLNANRTVGLYEIPPHISFARGRTPVDIHNDFMKSGEKKMNSNSPSTGGMAMPMSIPFFMTGMPLGHNLSEDMIKTLQLSSRLRNLYEDVYNKLKAVLGDDLSAWQPYVPLFSYVRSGESINGTKKREVPNINHTYCSFISSVPNCTLTTLFATYNKQLENVEAQLVAIQTALSSNDLKAVKDLANKLGHTMEQVSIISWDANLCKSDSDIKSALNIMFDDNKDSLSYKNAIYQQVVEILSRCKLAVENANLGAGKKDSAFKAIHKQILSSFVSKNKQLFDAFDTFINSWAPEDNSTVNEDWISKMEPFRDIIETLYTSQIKIDDNISMTIAEITALLDGWMYKQKTGNRRSSKASRSYLATPVTKVYPKLLKFNPQTFVPNRVGTPGNRVLYTDKVIFPSPIRIIGDAERINWNKMQKYGQSTVAPVAIPTPTPVPGVNPEPVVVDDIIELLSDGSEMSNALEYILSESGLISDGEFIGSKELKQKLYKLITSQDGAYLNTEGLTDPNEVGMLEAYKEELEKYCKPF